MKALKKDFTHLYEVATNIVDLTVSYIHYSDAANKSVKICFPACSYISSYVLGWIPRNYSFFIEFQYNNVYLIISYE